MTTVGKYRIMIYGPKEDGTYVVEFRTDGQVFALSIPKTETEVIRRFKERMPYGLFVPHRGGKKISPAEAGLEGDHYEEPPDLRGHQDLIAFSVA